ncbi:MAG: Panacea domain-containing protein [Acidobacteriaceae bacterium]
MGVVFKFDIDKAIAATIYIATRRPKPIELTQGKLFKLIYLSDKDHLVRFGRPITGDSYSAMEHGPVPSNLYNAFKDLSKSPSARSKDARALAKSVMLDTAYRYPRIEAQSEIDQLQLSESDMKSLDRIVKRFGKMTFSQVRQIAHDTPAWVNAWNSKQEDKDAAPMKFEDFFEDDPNALSGVKEEMLENQTLKMAFARR